jgi:hypothetical protein
VTCRNSKLETKIGLSSLFCCLLAVIFALSLSDAPQVVWAQENSSQATSPAQPLFWADGMTQVADLDAYVQTGLNTVVVRLTWRPTPDGSITMEDIRFPRAFADAAAAKGLKWCTACRRRRWGKERAFRIAGDSEPYL